MKEFSSVVKKNTRQYLMLKEVLESAPSIPEHWSKANIMVKVQQKNEENWVPSDGNEPLT